MKPDIDSDISLSAVTDVFCILRDTTALYRPIFYVFLYVTISAAKLSWNKHNVMEHEFLQSSRPASDDDPYAVESVDYCY